MTAARDRVITLVDRIVDNGHLNATSANVDGWWSGTTATCHVGGGELTATRVGRDRETTHTLSYSDGGDSTLIATDSRYGGAEGNVGHDRWGNVEEFLGWAEALR